MLVDGEVIFLANSKCALQGHFPPGLTGNTSNLLSAREPASWVLLKDLGIDSPFFRL